MSVLDVQNYIIERVHKSIFEFTHEPKRERKGIPVTSIAFPCERARYYDIVYRGDKPFSLDVTNRLWIGKALHTTNILGAAQEVEISGAVGSELEDIVGVIDEYNQQAGIVLEKKTIARIPFSVLEHHKFQAYAYCVILKDLKLPVNYVAWLYVSIKPVTFKVFTEEFTEEIYTDTRMKMVERKEKLVKALESNLTPNREISEMCRYCSWYYKCMSED
jgi:CRISPR/Cas system-associated exonuclease Cas4 (RecB family)